MDNFLVEVCYANDRVYWHKIVTVPEGASVLQAIHESGILSQFKEIDLAKNKVGIYGELVALTDSVRNQDRVEIYRPLMLDPKELRKRKARIQAKVKKELK